MDITSNEAAAVRWASSEEGRAQQAAAWGVAVRLGLDGYGVTRSDVNEMLWAGHQMRIPDEPETLPGVPQDDPRHARMLQLITDAGEAGITLGAVYRAMAAEGAVAAVARETLYRWADRDAATGLLEQFDGSARGVWRVVQR